MFLQTTTVIIREHNIEFVCLPPNSTDKLQPLDVAAFRPLKEAWRETLRTYKDKHPNTNGISKMEFPALLKQALDKADVGKHLPAGFRTCGLYPVSVEEAVKRIPARDMEEDDDEVRELMTSVVSDRLEALRGFDKDRDNNTVKPKRGKKIRHEDFVS